MLLWPCQQNYWLSREHLEQDNFIDSYLCHSPLAKMNEHACVPLMCVPSKILEVNGLLCSMCHLLLTSWPATIYHFREKRSNWKQKSVLSIGFCPSFTPFLVAFNGHEFFSISSRISWAVLCVARAAREDNWWRPFAILGQNSRAKRGNATCSLWAILKQNRGTNPTSGFGNFGGSSTSHHGIDDSGGKQRQLILFPALCFDAFLAAQ